MVTIRPQTTCHDARGSVHRRLQKTRIPARHALLAFAPLVATYLAAAGWVSLGGSLDLLWLLLTLSAIIHCVQQRGSAGSRVPQLLSLALVLALFFPVISLDDDRAQEELPGELQSLLSPPAKQKQSQASFVVHAVVPTPAPGLPVWLRTAAEPVTPLRPRISRSSWLQASGNHS